MEHCFSTLEPEKAFIFLYFPTIPIRFSPEMNHSLEGGVGVLCLLKGSEPRFV